MAVNLQKGQKISLSKEAGGSLTRIVMGLGWDVIKKKGFLFLVMNRSQLIWMHHAFCLMTIIK